MVRGEQIGGIELPVKLEFNTKKAVYAEKQQMNITNNDFLKELLQSWESSQKEKVGDTL